MHGHAASSHGSIPHVPHVSRPCMASACRMLYDHVVVIRRYLTAAPRMQGSKVIMPTEIQYEVRWGVMLLMRVAVYNTSQDQAPRCASQTMTTL